MAKTVEDYENLITTEYRDQPKFMATVDFLAALPVHVQDLLDAMIALYDLATPPVGDQLDTIGKWVGVSRNVSIPTTGVYLTWDETPSEGWDFGAWLSSSRPTTVTTLPDNVYINLIKAKIAANNWDGTTEGAYRIWEQVFPQYTILIKDFDNMNFMLAIVGGVIDNLTKALILGGYIPLRPEGVKATYWVSPDTEKTFAWNTENDLMGGWGEGSWLETA